MTIVPLFRKKYNLKHLNVFNSYILAILTIKDIYEVTS